MKSLLICLFGLFTVTIHAQMYSYDEFNRIVLSTYPAGTSTSYSYDKLGNRITETKSSNQITLLPRVYLQGPYITSAGMMTDSLRTRKYLPKSEPYTALLMPPTIGSGAAVNDTSIVWSARGRQSIVDWILLELRDKTDPAVVLHSAPFLVQRDGDIVGLDGVCAAIFYGVAADDYYVAIRHRNHLGVMTANPIPLSGATTSLDFTNGSVTTYGTNAQKSLPGSKWAMWSGNANGNGALSYNGSNNDRVKILTKVGFATPNNIVNGYLSEDVNMDGTVKYNGSSNDRVTVLLNVGIATPNNIITQQLP